MVTLPSPPTSTHPRHKHGYTCMHSATFCSSVCTRPFVWSGAYDILVCAPNLESLSLRLRVEVRPHGSAADALESDDDQSVSDDSALAVDYYHVGDWMGWRPRSDCFVLFCASMWLIIILTGCDCGLFVRSGETRHLCVCERGGELITLSVN